MKPLVLFSLLVISLLCFSQRSDKGQLGTIKGRVTTVDGQSAEAVSILIKGGNIGTITDQDGKFEFKKMKPGDYVLILSLSNYASREISATVKANEVSVLNVHLDQTYAELQKVIVQARIGKYVETKPSSSLRLNVPLTEIPQNIQITSRQLLIDQGLVSMSEAIRTVSGIQKNDGQLNDITLNIRGVSASFLNIYRNGLGQYWWNQQEDISMVEKIEFIKGAAGFIVSNFPPGGFVNIETKQPQAEPVGSINVEYGSFNLFRLTADWGGAFSKKSKFTYRLNAGVHRQNRAFEFSSASHYFICGAVKYEPNKKNTITAEYNYMWGKTSGNNFDIPSVNGKLFSVPRNFAIADSKTDNLIVADNYFRLLATHKFNNNWSLNLLLGDIYGKWGEDYYVRADPEIPVTNDTIYRFAEFDDWRNFSRTTQLYVNGTFHTGQHIEHKILTAIDYHDNGVTDPWGSTDSKFGLYIPDPNYYISPDSLKDFSIDHFDTIRSKSPSFYFEDHIKIRNKIILTLAGRFTHVTNKYITHDVPVYQGNTSYNHFTPRIGLNWLFSDAVSAYAIYDQFFIPIYEKNIERKPFKPLNGYNGEAGLKGYFLNKKLSAGISIYHLVSDNYISPDPLNPGFYVQLAQTIHNGVELDITGNITPSLMINANYAYAHAWLSKGDSQMVGREPVGTPDHYGNLWFKYKLLDGGLKGISFGIGYKYMGHRSALSYDDPGENVYLPVYSLLDAAISYRHEKFSISLNAYNITNTEYADMGIFKRNTKEWRYTPGEPINFRLSIAVNLVSVRKEN